MGKHCTQQHVRNKRNQLKLKRPGNSKTNMPKNFVKNASKLTLTHNENMVLTYVPTPTKLSPSLVLEDFNILQTE